jgi:hypothetical protein
MKETARIRGIAGESDKGNSFARIRLLFPLSYHRRTRAVEYDNMNSFARSSAFSPELSQANQGSRSDKMNSFARIRLLSSPELSQANQGSRSDKGNSFARIRLLSSPELHLPHLSFVCFRSHELDAVVALSSALATNQIGRNASLRNLRDSTLACAPAFQLPIQPGPRIGPMTLGGRRRKVEHPGRFRNLQPDKKSQFHQLCFGWIELG